MTSDFPDRILLDGGIDFVLSRHSTASPLPPVTAALSLSFYPQAQGRIQDRARASAREGCRVSA